MTLNTLSSGGFSRPTGTSTSPTFNRQVEATESDANVLRIVASWVPAPQRPGYVSARELARRFVAKNPDRETGLQNARKALSRLIEQDGQTPSLCQLRLRKGLSQTKLADLIGTSQADLSRIESGTQDPTSDKLKRLKDALGVEWADLMNAVQATRHG